MGYQAICTKLEEHENEARQRDHYQGYVYQISLHTLDTPGDTIMLYELRGLKTAQPAKYTLIFQVIVQFLNQLASVLPN